MGCENQYKCCIFAALYGKELTRGQGVPSFYTENV